MRRQVLTAVAVASLVLAAAPAEAHHHTYRGGCGVDSVKPPEGVVGPDEWVGVLSAAVVVDGPQAAVVTVTCRLWIDAAEYVAGPFTGVGGAAGAQPFVFSATEDSVVRACEEVTVGAHTTSVCTP